MWPNLTDFQIWLQTLLVNVRNPHLEIQYVSNVSKPSCDDLTMTCTGFNFEEDIKYNLWKRKSCLKISRWWLSNFTKRSRSSSDTIYYLHNLSMIQVMMKSVNWLWQFKPVKSLRDLRSSLKVNKSQNKFIKTVIVSPKKRTKYCKDFCPEC